MSLLSFMGQPAQVAPELYDGPTTRPYNSDGFLTFADPYGHNGSAVHPDVLDFGARGWRGHRFWMVCTPYHNKFTPLENPCLFYADEPTKFYPATQNPVYPAPSDPMKYNSDTDLMHDPVTDELVLAFRDGEFLTNYARSSDGRNWPPTTTVSPWPIPEGTDDHILSPAYVHDGTQWVAWGIRHADRAVLRWTAPAPEGPWTGPTVCSGFANNIWHFNIVQDDLGKFYCLVHLHNGTAFASSSADGITWTTNPTAVLNVRGPGFWDGTEMYRSAISLHEDGERMRVWYCGHGDGSDSFRIGYTQIPLSEWP